MFAVLLSDFDERYKPELDRLRAETDTDGEGSEDVRGSEHIQGSHP